MMVPGSDGRAFLPGTFSDLGPDAAQLYGHVSFAYIPLGRSVGLCRLYKSVSLFLARFLATAPPSFLGADPG